MSVGPAAERSLPPGPLGGDAFFSRLAEYSRSGYGASAGWTFWTARVETGDAHWSLFEAVSRGWMPRNLSRPPLAPMDCSASDTSVGSLPMLAAVALGSALGLSLVLTLLACTAPCCARRRRRLFSRLKRCACGPAAHQAAARRPEDDGRAELLADSDQEPPAASAAPCCASHQGPSAGGVQSP